MNREDFKALVQSHDFYYQYSDDRKVYDKGRRERESIEKIIQEDKSLIDIYHLYGKSLSH